MSTAGIIDKEDLVQLYDELDDVRKRAAIAKLKQPQPSPPPPPNPPKEPRPPALEGSTPYTHRFVLWFRNDLRVHDNPILAAAAAYTGPKEVLPIYVFDPRHFADNRMSPMRARFLIESVGALRESLKELGSGLLVALGRPEEIIPQLITRLDLGEIDFTGMLNFRLMSNFARATTILYQEQLGREAMLLDKVCVS